MIPAPTLPCPFLLGAPQRPTRCSPARSEQVRAPRQPLRAGRERGREPGRARRRPGRDPRTPSAAGSPVIPRAETGRPGTAPHANREPPAQGPRRGVAAKDSSPDLAAGRRTRDPGTLAHAGPAELRLPGPSRCDCGSAESGLVWLVALVVKGRSRGCELRAGGRGGGGRPGLWGFSRGTLGITAWTCVCASARPRLCVLRVRVSIDWVCEASPSLAVYRAPGWVSACAMGGGAGLGQVWVDPAYILAVLEVAFISFLSVSFPLASFPISLNFTLLWVPPE